MHNAAKEHSTSRNEITLKFPDLDFSTCSIKFLSTCHHSDAIQMEKSGQKFNIRVKMEVL
jgi:hypothetical protein